MLENVKNLLSDGVTALGGILIVFGLVNLGLTIKDGMRRRSALRCPRHDYRRCHRRGCCRVLQDRYQLGFPRGLERSDI